MNTLLMGMSYPGMIVSHKEALRLDTLSGVDENVEFYQRQLLPYSPREKCGIVGVHASYPVSIKYILLGLQHRGQEGAGRIVWNRKKDKWDVKKDVGLVHEVFKKAPRPNSALGFSGPLEEIRETVALGHVKYTTKGSAQRQENVQPLLRGGVALAHNGNLSNYEELRKKVGTVVTDTDTELIGLLFEQKHRRGERDFVDAFRSIEPMLKGSYSLTMINVEHKDGKTTPKVYGICDPAKIKPLKVAEIEHKGDYVGHIFVSEDCALQSPNGELTVSKLREVEPGEIVCAEKDGLTSYKCPDELKVPRAFCFFEYLYFARRSSTMEGLSVNSVRKELGARVAKRFFEIDVLSPIPNSGRAMAEGAAKALGLPYTDVFDINSYVGRSFIAPYARGYKAKLKNTPIPSVVDGKRIGLTDDSIVRGTTLTSIIKHLRKDGAKLVEVASSVPPIISPCDLGMDFPTHDELLAYKYIKSHPNYDAWNREHVDSMGAYIADQIGADGFYFAYLQDIEKVIPGGKCLKCVTGKSPVHLA